MSSSEAPPPNPFLTVYDGFVQRTPLVTRYLLSLQVVSYIVSWIANPHLALANIPYFVIFRFEIYRLILSPLVNSSIISLIFAFLSFSDHGKRLEQSMGSAAFGWLCLSAGFVVNLGFLSVSLVFYALTGFQKSALLSSSAGLWIIIFATLAIECAQAPRQSQRTLFFCTVPVLYYPLALYAFFAFISGQLILAYLLAVGVGYAYGFGYLPQLKLGMDRVKEWEDTFLDNLTRRQGWISGLSATGIEAWNEGSWGSGMSLPMYRSGEGGGTTARDDNGIRAGSVFRTGSISTTSSSLRSGSASSTHMVSNAGGGRTLGGGGGSNTNHATNGSGATRRSAAEARAARLQALERRAATSPDESTERKAEQA